MAKHLGKYEILGTLGQGAMGEVYLAHHPAIGRQVAIKTILPAAAKGADAEGRFRREAEAAGKLSHPNLVTIFDFDKDGDVLYLVMEYVKGEDLEDLIRSRALSPSQFLEVLAQVCDGLSHAHRNGIIHRDIKPTNVRVARDGRKFLTKVMDFGIARLEDSNLTATGIVMGTVSYMAPEYIRLGHATTQSDLFAVGVMLYECLTGQKPFDGDNTTTILFKIVSDPVPPLDPSAITGISQGVRAILDKALAKDPAERFQTADDFAKALRACKDPSWSGTLEEATAMIARHPSSAPLDATERMPQAPPPETLAHPALAPSSSNPTAAAPALASVPPRAASAPPAAAQAPAPAKGRGGLYAAAGIALLAVAGGAFFLANRSRTVVPTPESAAAPPLSGASAPAPSLVGKPVGAPAPLPATSPSAPGAAAARETLRPAEALRPEPPKPAEPAKPAGAPALPSDPKQAAALLKAQVQANPGSAELNGLYLAALYRARNAWDFERALTRAHAAGVSPKALFSVPAFRSAMIEERNLRKAGKGEGLLPEEVMDKILSGL